MVKERNKDSNPQICKKWCHYLFLLRLFPPRPPFFASRSWYVNCSLYFNLKNFFLLFSPFSFWPQFLQNKLSRFWFGQNLKIVSFLLCMNKLWLSIVLGGAFTKKKILAHMGVLIFSGGGANKGGRGSNVVFTMAVKMIISI